jgi:hypothetical protein
MARVTRIKESLQFLAELFDLSIRQDTNAREVTVFVVKGDLFIRQPKLAPLCR